MITKTESNRYTFIPKEVSNLGAFENN